MSTVKGPGGGDAGNVSGAGKTNQPAKVGDKAVGTGKGQTTGRAKQRYVGFKKRDQSVTNRSMSTEEAKAFVDRAKPGEVTELGEKLSQTLERVKQMNQNRREGYGSGTPTEARLSELSLESDILKDVEIFKNDDGVVTADRVVSHYNKMKETIGESQEHLLEFLNDVDAALKDIGLDRIESANVDLGEVNEFFSNIDKLMNGYQLFYAENITPDLVSELLEDCDKVLNDIYKLQNNENIEIKGESRQALDALVKAATQELNDLEECMNVLQEEGLDDDVLGALGKEIKDVAEAKNEKASKFRRLMKVLIGVGIAVAVAATVALVAIAVVLAAPLVLSFLALPMAIPPLAISLPAGIAMDDNKLETEAQTQTKVNNANLILGGIKALKEGEEGVELGS